MSDNNSTEPVAPVPAKSVPAANPYAPSPDAPPAPYLPTPGVPKQKNGLALAALIVGIAALVCAVIPGFSFIAFAPALTALGLGIAALAGKGGGKGQAITAIILGPIALLIAISVSIVSIASSVTPNLGSSDDDPVAEAPVDEPDQDEPEEQPEPAPAGEGTRQNPAPVGSTIVISDNSGAIWEVTLGAASLNANDIIASENQFNDAPDAGHQYVLVPVTYTYVGTESGTPWLDVDISFVSAAGTTHEDAFVVTPNDVTDINELYPDASATGNFVVMAPSDNIEGGAWAISTFLSDKYFVAVV